VRELAERSEPDEGRRELILASYRRLADKPVYMPLFMDFRGRVYGRSNLVTYQGRDLQKSLMCFPSWPQAGDELVGMDGRVLDAIVAHMAALCGGQYKLDKASMADRYSWWNEFVRGRPPNMQMVQDADEPLQLFTAWDLLHSGQWDRIACQIDGTCNGLQHLSALFRDDTAAPYVNLVASNPEAGPADIYAEVAKRVAALLDRETEPWARRLRGAVTIDRKLCKKSVMVLPYGGTRTTIEDAVLEAILDQDPSPVTWTFGRQPSGSRVEIYDDWLDGNYGAFVLRELKDHPLLHLDAKRLGGLVWDAIVEILPKPMAAMQAFRDIAKAVGGRSLEWSTGFERPIGGTDPSCLPALWVVQAKARSDATGLKFKGFHLPGSVRGLRIRPGRDEVDPHAHTSGIVANFIHSQDASHLARTMALFRDRGGKGFGAIHDCFITRPSQMSMLGRAAREAFEAQYVADPLAQPVRLRTATPAGGTSFEEHPSWYALAAFYGVSFPERGSWDPAEVTQSAWFFS
jgi:DNA-directed RNA polymerase